MPFLDRMVDSFADWLGLEPDPNPPVRTWEARSRLARKAAYVEQPSYRPAPGYPHVQYAQDSYQPQIYDDYPQQQNVYRVGDSEGACATFDASIGAFRVPVTLPMFVPPHKFQTEMLYDPGATTCQLSHEHAQHMGLNLRELTYKIPVQSATRKLHASQFDLPVMRVGDIQLDDVKVMIMNEDLGCSLLGQSALRKLRTEQDGDRVIFRRR